MFAIGSARLAALAASLAIAVAAPGAAADTGASPTTYVPGSTMERSHERPSTLRVNLEHREKPVVHADMAGFGPTLDIAGLVWTGWGAETASARGRLTYHWSQSGSPRGPVDVEVTMREPVDCHGWRIYSRYTIAVLPGAAIPAGFGDVAINRSVERGCHPMQRWCDLPATSCSGVGGYFTLAFLSKANAGFTWRGFDSREAVGVGFLHRVRPFGYPRGLVKQWTYPVRVRLTEPRWCNGMVTYTKVVTELFGTGARFSWNRGGDPEGTAPRGEIRRRLLRDVGRDGVRKRTDVRSFGRRCQTSQPG